jgi:beta-1,4-N-acetylglucosaminyltransferase
MIFLTVGTQFPFDRLVQSVDKIFAQHGGGEKIFAQIGNSSYRPCNFEAVPSLGKHLFDKHICEASCIISHAGIGTITMALKHGKPLLVMPRRQRYGEVVNDHQLDIAKKFEQLDYLLVAYKTEELSEKIDALESFIPRKWKSHTEKVVERISTFLKEVCE